MVWISTEEMGFKFSQIKAKLENFKTRFLYLNLDKKLFLILQYLIQNLVNWDLGMRDNST
jgi:hypothetical protein